MRCPSKLVSLALFAGGLFACTSDPSVNVTLVVTISNGGTSSDAGASVPAPPPSSSGSGGGSDDGGGGRPAFDGGEAGQAKVDAANQDGAPSSTCQPGTACDTGTIVIEAGVNHCPEFLPSTTTRTSSTMSTIVVAAVDRDGDRLTYAWTATSGTFSDPASFDTGYTCDMPGNQTLTVTVSDGQCQTALDFSIACP